MRCSVWQYGECFLVLDIYSQFSRNVITTCPNIVEEFMILEIEKRKRSGKGSWRQRASAQKRKILNRRGRSHRKKAATQNARICDKGANEGTWRAGAEEAPPQKRKLKGQIQLWI